MSELGKRASGEEAAEGDKLYRHINHTFLGVIIRKHLPTTRCFIQNIVVQYVSGICLVNPQAKSIFPLTFCSLLVKGKTRQREIDEEGAGGRERDCGFRPDWCGHILMGFVTSWRNQNVWLSCQGSQTLYTVYFFACNLDDDCDDFITRRGLEDKNEDR